MLNPYVKYPGATDFIRMIDDKHKSNAPRAGNTVYISRAIDKTPWLVFLLCGSKHRNFRLLGRSQVAAIKAIRSVTDCALFPDSFLDDGEMLDLFVEKVFSTLGWYKHPVVRQKIIRIKGSVESIFPTWLTESDLEYFIAREKRQKYAFFGEKMLHLLDVNEDSALRILLRYPEVTDNFCSEITDLLFEQNGLFWRPFYYYSISSADPQSNYPPEGRSETLSRLLLLSELDEPLWTFISHHCSTFRHYGAFANDPVLALSFILALHASFGSIVSDVKFLHSHSVDCQVYDLLSHTVHYWVYDLCRQLINECRNFPAKNYFTGRPLLSEYCGLINLSYGTLEVVIFLCLIPGSIELDEAEQLPFLDKLMRSSTVFLNNYQDLPEVEEEELKTFVSLLEALMLSEGLPVINWDACSPDLLSSVIEKTLFECLGPAGCRRINDPECYF